MKPPRATPVAADFDAAAIAAIIRRVQQGALRYPEFCAEVMRAGCAGYLVSLPGRRAVYFGRTGETHVEHFPAAT